MISRILQFSFLTLIFSLGFMQPSFFAAGFRLPFTDLIFPIVFSVWVMAVLLKKIDFRGSKFYLPLIFYFFALLVSAVFSVDQRQSFVKLCGELYLVGLAVLSFNLIRSMRDARIAVCVWLAATFAASVICSTAFIIFYVDRTNPMFLFAFSHYGTLPPGNYPRIHGTFQNANMLCNYLSVGFPLLLVSIRLKWINSINSLILLIFLSIAGIFTISPSLGGILLSIGLWFWVDYKENKKSRIARLSLIGGILFAVLFFLSTLINPAPTETSPYYLKIPLTEKRVDPSGRVLAWQSALQTWFDNPMVGRGTGLDAANVRYKSPSGGLQVLGDAHQMWLNVAAQAGIIGLSALCFLCVFLFRRTVVFSFADQKSTLQTALGIAFISAFLYQGLTGSYEDARHLWVLIGFLSSVAENDFPKVIEND